MEGEPKRNKIEEAVRKLMKDAKGVVARERAHELKKKVESCLESGGSSLLAIDKLIGQILSL
jgi:hypothetical protein